MFKRYRRAQKWLQEQNPDNHEAQYEDSTGDLPSMEELRREANENVKLDKSDWLALLIAGFGTILIPCALFLLFIVGVAIMLFS